ncbi:MAG: hypothetical protein NTW98_00735 [Candidatus Nomurabacteria bacterium]|nr:hypothetical protein [Candidatus Nomurabacteria bacterium]
MVFKKGYIAVYGDSIPIKIDRFLMGGKKEIKASTWPPFIFFKDESCEIPWIVNHELIHFRQAYELLFVGAVLLETFDRIYARVFLKMSASEAYHYSSLEQEAYLNHNNPNYLQTRKLFSVFNYFKNKKKFSMDRNGIVIVQD